MVSCKAAAAAHEEEAANADTAAAAHAAQELRTCLQCILVARHMAAEKAAKERADQANEGPAAARQVEARRN